PADRIGDVARVQGPGRDLIEQRLEQVVVATIQERDLDRRVGELARGFEPAEPTADDHDMRLHLPPWMLQPCRLVPHRPIVDYDFPSWERPSDSGPRC